MKRTLELIERVTTTTGAISATLSASEWHELREGLSSIGETVEQGSPDVPPITKALGTLLQDMVTMLNQDADKSKAQNYTAFTMEWTGALLPHLPFDRVEILFLRPGAMNPAAIAGIERSRREGAEFELKAMRDRLHALEASMVDSKGGV